VRLTICPNLQKVALIAKLPAGAYTAIVAGKGGRAGVGLVEFYNMQ